ncbi:hypothetical protein FHX82_006488 [Amycolatopsis bartoniae]|uniref:HTH-type transcriptional repressor KstR2 C-terminal domain-containing protein n=1 Tax=Amycolatopsis bartoniae TaxID=941986 RepID=A0A8H9J2H2_9PSEU|nr:hypothetical protein [Amycolatopsis bartoniae]MBB2939402.1 hypothetical protein [Amycolatopsis bartoniae]TVT00959.1 hypothetical protein FNH07_30445 [Amycolatopsis bartoniae]GHF83255.1 hypothetical protein GCM10017566_66640 [Amycolatopsis bartoniae]
MSEQLWATPEQVLAIALQAITHEFQALLDESLAAQREPPPIDTHVAANLVLSMLTTVYRWHEPGGPVTPEQLTEQIALLLKGLLP